MMNYIVYNIFKGVFAENESQGRSSALCFLPSQMVVDIYHLYKPHVELLIVLPFLFNLPKLVNSSSVHSSFPPIHIQSISLLIFPHPLPSVFKILMLSFAWQISRLSKVYTFEEWIIVNPLSFNAITLTWPTIPDEVKFAWPQSFVTVLCPDHTN